MKLHDWLMFTGLIMSILTVTLRYMDALPDELGWVLVGSMTTLIIVAAVFEYTEWKLTSKGDGNG